MYLFQDGDGLTAVGEPATVERFLHAEELWAMSENVAENFGQVLGVGSAAMRGCAEIAAGSARWLKITEESAARLEKMGLRKSATTGLSTTVLRGKTGGQIGGFLEIAKGPGSLLNPATLAGVAGVMGQLALQRALAEINTKLTAIDEKATAILHNQRIGEIAQLNGARLSIQEAVTIRESVGRVTADQWSTVQQEHGRIATLQAQALGQLRQIADGLDDTARIGDLAKALKRAEHDVPLWLWVLTHACLLHHIIQELELDREKQTSPDDAEAIQRGMHQVRQDRVRLIAQVTDSLLDSLTRAARRADAKVLLNPVDSPAIVKSRNRVAASIGEFHELLGLDLGLPDWPARQWTEAAAHARDLAIEIGTPVAEVAAKVALPIALSYLGKKKI
ncbi:hypothetical protein O7626_03295 [Micromonospora sp. WMMD1102]|uniref:hypothetical protein n=1 Tax=Micromonospora sp. WMMD1102 TaxID=3016105 RepID=UPI0024153BD4|nr:hypothetical protein [Micromonospora sp. WMMD1102]MDG4784966.1 hypothetical protein [Micromonospora sp. WMMD1102]